MFDTIANTIKDNIKTLPYVGRIAGLVRTAVQFIDVDAGDGQKVVLSEKRFPVACGVTGMQCWQQGRYQELAPNQSYASVMYFEQGGNLQFEQGSRSEVSLTAGRLRLVCWFNLPKIGIDTGCITPEAIVLELIARVQMTSAITAYGLNNAQFTSKVVGFSRTPDIFSKYSYDKSVIENMLLYPYDYFALDIDVKLLLSEKCYIPYVPSVEVTCIDLS